MTLDVHPLLNACLNATSVLLLAGGFRAIRRGDVTRHKRFMVGAFGASVVFLASYLLRFWLTGSTRFPVEGGWKTLYLVILASHSLLAAVLVPMVLRTVWLPWKGRFPQHRKLARFTFPLWLYVSVTGVVVYLMLYHLPSIL
ncbi:MAG TPA: DUF420 domain-containing protein [Vulgatibacter sp.]